MAGAGVPALGRPVRHVATVRFQGLISAAAGNQQLS
jgi:hypothetical protein